MAGAQELASTAVTDVTDGEKYTSRLPERYVQRVLFLVFGSSAAGKTYLLTELGLRSPDRLAIHDFDEIDVPPDADIAWRQRANELWLERALDYQSQEVDLLLAGQTPFGEFLASPSAPRLEAISACLLDCSDEVRLERLKARGPGWLEQVSGNPEDYLRWAAWMRQHAADPRFMTHVIRHAASPPEMRWERWSEWESGDPRWRVSIIDTSTQPVDEIADEVAAWIESERELLRSGEHPLSRWAE